MTVIIHAPAPGNMRALAEACVDDALAARTCTSKHYDSNMRERAIDAIVDYQPAYIRLSEYSDNLGTLACKWALGDTQAATINLDPPRELRGLRQVAAHIMALWPMDGRERLIKVLRNLQPINAMALLDRELLIEERGLAGEDIDWTPEAAQRRADAYKAEQAKKMINVGVK